MKNILRNLISFIAYYTKSWHLLYALCPLLKRKHLLVVLTFHRVIPKEKAKDFVTRYDIGQDNKNYEMILQLINKYFQIIDLDEFISYVNGFKKLKQHSVLITFDDADNEFMDYALPVLEKNKWPAVVFAPTGYIDTDKHFWHLKVSSMMHRMNNNIWQKIILNKTIFTDKIQKIIGKYPEYSRSLYYPLCRDFIIYLNSIKDEEIFLIIEQFEELIGAAYSLPIKCMGWGQLKELEKHGVAIESHSVTHRKLEHLDKENILIELKDSKSKIESMLDKKVKAFCYPAGSHSEQVLELIRDTDYEVAFTTQDGICKYPLDSSALFKIPRLSIGGENRMEINFEIGRLLFKK